MCYLNFPFPEWDPDEPLPRAFPRLEWAIPVNITALGANLEAYSNIDRQINCLRLSHRFGQGPLSKIPQEILEMIIDEAQQLERRKLRPSWEKRFACFRGRCTPGQHYNPYGPYTEMVWRKYFNLFPDPERGSLDPGDYTEEEKVKMLEAKVGAVDLLHEHSIQEWLDSVCLCESIKSSSKARNRNWRQLSDILRARFGLEMYIMHELVSPELKAMEPYPSFPEHSSYYTSAFLTLFSDTAEKCNSSRLLCSKTNQIFVLQGSHAGFRQTIKPSALVLSDKQRQRFAKAMRALGLSPYYHFTELESLISQLGHDAALWEICGERLSGYFAPSPTSQESRAKKLKEYMRKKNKELAEQSWP